MPKRGGQRSYNSNNNGGSTRSDGGARIPAIKGHHNPSHDDHKQRNNTRRVSFKPSSLQQKGGVRLRISESALRSRLEDDDDMHEMTHFSEKFFEDRAVNRRKGSPIPRGKFGNSRKLMPNAYGWYQITVHNGQLYSKDDVIRALLAALSPYAFIPQYWRIEKNCIIFFTDDFETADRIQQMGRNAQMTDGFRLLPRVRSGFPIISVDDDFKEKMKMVMAKRYNAATKALDLSKFHADPDFKNTFCPLFRTPVLSAALEIIESNIPDLEALNLNENNLTSLEAFRFIDKRLPKLRIIYLADNKLSSLAHLLVFRNLKVVEAMLKNNPYCTRYKERAQYVSEVRRKFPKIVKLDGEPLEPQILFDMNDTSMPQAKASFLCDPAGADIVRQFLEQYFNIFDSDNRQPLLDAYHEQAMMSISVPPASQAGRLVNYWKYNRNFRRLLNNDRENNKISLLKVGRLAVVSTLAELPKTMHDRQTFTVDLTLFTPQMMSFTVTGLFREYNSEREDAPLASTSATATGDYELRYFVRNFIIVPHCGGFCIRNETVLITSATFDQLRSYKRQQLGGTGAGTGVGAGTRSETASTNTTTSTGAAATLSGLSTSLQSRLQLREPPQQMMQQPMQRTMGTNTDVQVPDEATIMQMVQAMSVQSNMNLEWSRKCLEETNWDFNHAAFVFEKLLKENKIPPEAFIK